MGTGHFFGMEPPVISGRLFKRQLIILEVVFAHKDIKSVTGNIVEGFGFCMCFGTLFAGIMLFDVTILGKLFLDLAQITFCTGNIECVGYGFQMLDLGFGIGKLFVQSFFRTLEFAIAVKIFFGVFLWGEGRIQRNGDFFVGVIIQCLERFASLFQTIAVGVDEFTVDLVFVLFGSVLHLFLLKCIFLAVTFKGSLHDSAKVGRLLADAVQSITGCVVGLQHG